MSFSSQTDHRAVELTDTPPEILPEVMPGEVKRHIVLFLLHNHGAEMVPLTPGTPIVVGRKPPSDICLRDPKLSREHARFSLSEDCQSVRVEDLGSTNGTWLGTQRLQRAQLTFGQEVRLGGVLVRPHAFKDTPVVPSPDSLSAEDALIAGKGMRELMEKVERMAASRAPVILHGETGTGKEVLAGLLHKRGPRRDKLMVRINCGSIPAQLVESTLFGHERGAFTGAVQQHKGVFEEAHGGLVFLDEIGELALSAQPALLRVLETGQLTRVGSSRELSVDVRVIAATHRDLPAMVQQGRFREDLYYRLSALTIELPPLRERTDEIEPLALHFLRQANAENGGRIKGIAPGAMERLRAYSWPGNVRELRNVIGGAVLISRSSYISEQDLPAKMLEARETPRSDGPTQPIPVPPARPEAASPRPAGDAEGELRLQVQQYEARLIRETLRAMSWNRADAARRLGMPLRTLAHKIKVLGIKKDPP
jgi:transcriptional regulator with GAF, ATPase, and Fis domain